MMKLQIKELSKRYGQKQILEKVSFSVQKQECLAVLGPSGCGKTTLLKLISGLQYPDEGFIYKNNELISSRDWLLAPSKRNIGMIFQHYALWPHMTVYNNIAYGLIIRKFSKKEIMEKVNHVLKLVKLENHGKKYPSQLSGGQQQRISLARAIVVEPEVLLFDEPLSNLDAKLREQLRLELKELMYNTKLTSVYVTHDQDEAMAVGDRIVIMNEGVIEQIGLPEELYNHSRNSFVANFFGKSNIIKGRVKGRQIDFPELETPMGPVFIQGPGPDNLPAVSGKTVEIAIRIEDIRLLKKGEESRINSFPGTVISRTYLGCHFCYTVKCGDEIITARTGKHTRFNKDDRITIHFPPEACQVLEG